MCKNFQLLFVYLSTFVFAFVNSCICIITFLCFYRNISCRYLHKDQQVIIGPHCLLSSCIVFLSAIIISGNFSELLQVFTKSLFLGNFSDLLPIIPISGQFFGVITSLFQITISGHFLRVFTNYSYFWPIFKSNYQLIRVFTLFLGNFSELLPIRVFTCLQLAISRQRIVPQSQNMKY